MKIIIFLVLFFVQVLAQNCINIETPEQCAILPTFNKTRNVYVPKGSNIDYIIQQLQISIISSETLILVPSCRSILIEFACNNYLLRCNEETLLPYPVCDTICHALYYECFGNVTDSYYEKFVGMGEGMPTGTKIPVNCTYSYNPYTNENYWNDYKFNNVTYTCNSWSEITDLEIICNDPLININNFCMQSCPIYIADISLYEAMNSILVIIGISVIILSPFLYLIHFLISTEARKYPKNGSFVLILCACIISFGNIFSIFTKGYKDLWCGDKIAVLVGTINSQIFEQFNGAIPNQDKISIITGELACEFQAASLFLGLTYLSFVISANLIFMIIDLLIVIICNINNVHQLSPLEKKIKKICFWIVLFLGFVYCVSIMGAIWGSDEFGYNVGGTFCFVNMLSSWSLYYIIYSWIMIGFSFIMISLIGIIIIIIQTNKSISFVKKTTIKFIKLYVMNLIIQLCQTMIISYNQYFNSNQESINKFVEKITYALTYDNEVPTNSTYEALIILQSLSISFLPFIILIMVLYTQDFHINIYRKILTIIEIVKGKKHITDLFKSITSKDITGNEMTVTLDVEDISYNNSSSSSDSSD